MLAEEEETLAAAASSKAPPKKLTQAELSKRKAEQDALKEAENKEKVFPLKPFNCSRFYRLFFRGRFPQ